MGYVGGTKSWKFQHRVKGIKDPRRKKIGTYPVVGVVKATARAKNYGSPVESRPKYNNYNFDRERAREELSSSFRPNRSYYKVGSISFD